MSPDFPTRTLEQYLLDRGILDDRELRVAKKIQEREQGPLLMVLLRLNLIDVDQLSNLWDIEAAAWT
ncbi:MAG: DUF2949 domain-containing protein [Cyanobacteria bacterium J06642_2]